MPSRCKVAVTWSARQSARITGIVELSTNTAIEIQCRPCVSIEACIVQRIPKSPREIGRRVIRKALHPGLGTPTVFEILTQTIEGRADAVGVFSCLSIHRDITFPTVGLDSKQSAIGRLKLAALEFVVDEYTIL